MSNTSNVSLLVLFMMLQSSVLPLSVTSVLACFEVAASTSARSTWRPDVQTHTLMPT